MNKLKQAATNLVSKLDEVHANQEYEAVWAIHQMHAGPYKGPTYGQELEKLREALKRERD